MTTVELAVTIAIIAGGTALTRFLLFLIFPSGRPTPGWVAYLGRCLPRRCSVCWWFTVSAA